MGEHAKKTLQSFTTNKYILWYKQFLSSSSDNVAVSFVGTERPSEIRLFYLRLQISKSVLYHFNWISFPFPLSVSHFHSPYLSFLLSVMQQQSAYTPMSDHL